MFQVEQRFERSMIKFGGQEPPIRHYPIAEVVAGHLVWHIIGIQPMKEPDGHVYKRRTHLMVTKAGIAAEILNQNAFEEVTVFVVTPPLSPSSPTADIKRCTAIFECNDKSHPSTKAWGCDCGSDSFVDPSDDIDSENIVSKKILWKSKW
ncbi:hypothetical protein MASR1M59_20960 [Melaminivora sp.]